jgi:mannose-6-phosphate isomerase-like protein (cupin superfamily)
METTLQRKMARRVFVNPLFKDKATVLKTSEETGGRYLLGLLEVAPGGGNPMHTHSLFEETFTAVEGMLGVQYGDKEIYLNPGESLTIPVHQPHNFFNRGKKPVICQVKLTPAHEGFIKGIAILYGLAADGKTSKKGIPKNLMHLALFSDLMDTMPVGLIGWFAPLFRRLAARARKKGIEEALLEKYYYE